MTEVVQAVIKPLKMASTIAKLTKKISESTATVSSMNIGPAETDAGWSKMKANVKDIRLTEIRNQESLDRILDLFDRQISRWMGGVDLSDMRELLSIIRLNAMSLVANNMEHVWMFNLHTEQSQANVALVALAVSTTLDPETGTSSANVQWQTIDSSFATAPTVRIIQHSKSNIWRSKSWSEMLVIPRAANNRDVLGLLEIISAAAHIAGGVCAS